MGPLKRIGRRRRTVLLVSNGHGEDAVGATLAKHLQPRAAVRAYPLVGTGTAYGAIPLLQPVRSLPSGGFAARGAGVAEDLRAGALGHWWRQRRALRARAGRDDLVVAVGDAFCVWMAAAARAPAVLIATAKSARHDPHGWLDVAVMRSVAAQVFCRDEETASHLRAQGIAASCVGNPLMDTIGQRAAATLRRPDRYVVVLLPGSRRDAPQNLVTLLRLANLVSQRVPVTWLCPLAPGIDRGVVTRKAREIGWTAEATSLRNGTAEVILTGDFGGALSDADLVVGLAGTANEQAAGMGKPVVAFPGPGPQFTPRFLAAQQRLLSDGLVAAPTWTVGAAAVVRLLGDPEERLRRGAAGRIRMGPSGGIARIAGEILTILNAQARKRASRNQLA